MKRGAEKQLTRDDDEEEVDVLQELGDSDTGADFKKADPTTIASRPIRALPRRATAKASPALSSSSVISEPEAPPVPKFSGFKGFGTSATGTIPSSFTGLQKPPAPPTTTTSFSTPSLSAFSSATPTFPPSDPVAAASAPISNATKLFTSIVNASSQPEPKTQNGYHTPSDDDERVKVETAYYTALRGLNVAFLAACKKAVDADPYVNVAEVLERYNTLRASTKSDYDANIKKLSTSTASPESAPATSAPTSLNGFGGPSPVTSATSAPSAGPKNTFAMPSAPSGFAGFAFGSAAPTAPPNDGGSKPPLSSAASGSKSFTFGPSAANTSGKGTDDGSAPASVKSAFSFGSTAAGTTFTFGEKAASTSTTAGIGGTPSVFSSSLFGASQPSEDTKDKESDKPKDTAPATSIFGSSVASAEKPASSTSTPFAFGAGANSAPKSGSFFSFGKTGSGSIGNPVGFGFGSPPRTPEASSMQPSSTSGFTFGAPKVSAATDGEGGSSEPADDAPPPLVTNTVHDQDGEGEEDENTAYEQKCKVFKMAKTDSGVQEWKDLGIGMLKVKVHKESDARRLLLRNSSTGKILINFNVHAGMNPTAAKNVVSFMGHEEGASAPYKIRVKTNDQAEQVKRILEEEVEKARAKSS